MSRTTALRSKVSEHLRAGLQVSETSAYLVRDSIVHILKPARRITWGATYHVHDYEVFLEHGNDDTFVFQEIFVRRLYAPPAPISKILKGYPLQVLDLGGNIGLFGLWVMLHWPGADLVAFEPDPVNAEKYKRFLNANRSKWTLVEACASTEDGVVGFSARGKASSAVSDSDNALEVEAADVLPLMLAADFIKMDIEGGEWRILLDERFGRIKAPVIVLEYHPQRCPNVDARSTVVTILNDAGYSVHDIFHEQGGLGMLWAYKQESALSPNG